jgi:hypothetical protein
LQVSGQLHAPAALPPGKIKRKEQSKEKKEVNRGEIKDRRNKRKQARK